MGPLRIGASAAATLARRQHGFVVPLAEWFRTNLREFVLDLSRDTRTRERGFFDFEQMDRLIAAHLDGSEDAASAIYGLVMVELWHRTFLDGAQAPS